jgi:hypothetical protein
MFYRAKATNAVLFAPYVYAPTHRLNMELDLQSFIRAPWTAVLIVWELACNSPLPPHLGTYTRAHWSAKIDHICIFVTPLFLPLPRYSVKHYKMRKYVPHPSLNLCYCGNFCMYHVFLNNHFLREPRIVCWKWSEHRRGVVNQCPSDL